MLRDMTGEKDHQRDVVDRPLEKGPCVFGV